jgi:hypothetical protein
MGWREPLAPGAILAASYCTMYIPMSPWRTAGAIIKYPESVGTRRGVNDSTGWAYRCGKAQLQLKYPGMCCISLHSGCIVHTSVVGAVRGIQRYLGLSRRKFCSPPGMTLVSLTVKICGGDRRTLAGFAGQMIIL